MDTEHPTTAAVAANSAERLATLRVRAAIVHDWFQGYHGAERAADAMRSGLFDPETPAEVYTFHAAKSLLPPELAAAIVKESYPSLLPGVRQRGHDPGRWRWLLPYMPHYFRSLDLSDYELVVSSSHACAHHVRAPKGVPHVSYVYTPMRYAWMTDTERKRAAGLKAIALRAFSSRLRKLDLTASQHPDVYVAISTAVQERIRRFWGRDALVVHPPVEVDEFDPTLPKEPGRFLWVHRLVSYKQPELVAEAFRDLPYRLTMVGVGPLEARLRATLPSNVDLLPWLSREDLAGLYARASGFIHIGEEDFGITMVEAMAAGVPVIAINRGGARDIVRPGLDGVLVEQAELGELRRAIDELAGGDWDSQRLAARAREFSAERFVTRMLEIVTGAHAGAFDRRA
jgi:glycosyltransferase involved in cell wall biosynthesis